MDGELKLTVGKDTQSPMNYVVEGQYDAHVLSTTGKHDDYRNINIHPVALANYAE